LCKFEKEVEKKALSPKIVGEIKNKNKGERANGNQTKRNRV